MSRPTFAEDAYFPQYHFRPERNWINDPNGLIYWEGWYHLFYQYNPDGSLWGNIHWGHAGSRDLVHWEDRPITLSPGGPDEGGCWSGTAVVHSQVPTLVYTGIRNGEQVQCLATAFDQNLDAFHKKTEPVIASPPPGMILNGFRDPCLWKQGDGWYMLLGAGEDRCGGEVLLYRSEDLEQWLYLKVFFSANEELSPLLFSGPGVVWECPAFFSMGERHDLVLSTWNGSGERYTVLIEGKYDPESLSFTPLSVRKFDLADNVFYAPQTMLDDTGRRLMWGWLMEGRSRDAQVKAGWSGVQSLPKVLSTAADGSLQVEFARELQALRGDYLYFKGMKLHPMRTIPCQAGDQVEIVLDMRGEDALDAGLRIFESPDGIEVTRLVVDWSARRLYLDRRFSSLDGEADHGNIGGSLDLPAGEPLHLHIYIDHSVIEVIANHKVCLSGRVYPLHADSRLIGLFTEGGAALVESYQMWQMRSIW